MIETLVIAAGFGVSGFFGYRFKQAIKGELQKITSAHTDLHQTVGLNAANVYSKLSQVFGMLSIEVKEVKAAIPPPIYIPFDRRPDEIKVAMESAFKSLESKVEALRERVDHGMLNAIPQRFSSDEVAQVLNYVCEHLGLDPTKITPTFDLSATGKLHEILARMAEMLGQAHPLKTAEDVVKMFAEMSEKLKVE